MTATSVAGGPSVRELRRWIAHRRRFRASSLWFRLYLVALVGLPALGVAVNTDPQVTAERAGAVVQTVERWLPVILAAGLVGCARIGTWAGLVVPAQGELAWVFSAPLSRTRLLRGRVAYGLWTSAAIGALVAYFGALLIVVEIDAPVVWLLAAAVMAGALLGVAGGAAVWWTQSSGQRAQQVLRLTPHVTAGLLVLAVGLWVWPALGQVLLWSGPWGWASVVVVAGATGEIGAAPVAAGLLVVAAVACAAWVLVTAPGIPLEELARRAAAVSGIQAAMFFLDVRQAAELRRSAQRTLRIGAARRVRPPTRPGLIVPWTDLRELLRSPGWAGTLAATAGVVTLVAMSQAVNEVGEPLLAPVSVGVLGGAVVAMQLVAPLRTESSYPFADRCLPWSSARMTWLHLIAPTLLLTLAVAVAWGVAAILGVRATLAVQGLGLSLLAGPLLLLTAALGATLPPAAPGLLAMGDAGAMAFGARLFAGPQLAGIAVLAPTIVMLLAEDRPGTAELMTMAVLWSGVVGAGLALWLHKQSATTSDGEAD